MERVTFRRAPAPVSLTYLSPGDTEAGVGRPGSFCGGPATTLTRGSAGSGAGPHHDSTATVSFFKGRALFWYENPAPVWTFPLASVTLKFANRKAERAG